MQEGALRDIMNADIVKALMIKEIKQIKRDPSDLDFNTQFARLEQKYIPLSDFNLFENSRVQIKIRRKQCNFSLSFG
ncbi:MAG: hypothetical protein LBU35_00895 [Holosporales bacterium]|jgi:hypothetical protein|nr:hypothetical protein [Holosporales bacterium]